MKFISMKSEKPEGNGLKNLKTNKNSKKSTLVSNLPILQISVIPQVPQPIPKELFLLTGTM